MRQESYAPAGSNRDPERRAVKINMGYAKIHGEILHSTVWVGQPGSVRLTWLTMLILADEAGYVGASVPGLASTAGCTIPECEAALELFKAPDRHSRTKDHEGRRIVDADGGWIVLNHWKYRDYRTTKQVQAARRQAAFKERQRERIENGAPRVTRARRTAAALPASALTQVTRAHVLCLDPLEPDQNDPDPDPLQADPKDPTGSARLPSGVFDAPVLLPPSAALTSGVPESWRGPKPRHEARAAEAGLNLALEADRFRTTHFYTPFPSSEAGVDKRFDRWLIEAKVRAETDRAKAAHGGGGLRVADDPGTRGHERTDPTSDHRAFAAEHGLDVDAILAALERDPKFRKLGTVRKWDALTRVLEREAERHGKRIARTGDR